MVMVPATVSRIDHWIDLAQFMGQRFTTHFFELPGHGGSSPFKGPYSSDLVAQSIEHFIDELGFDTFTLMGFSFGGMLTLKTLALLEDRVDRVVMIAPCVSHRALTFSSARKWVLKKVAQFLRMTSVQKKVLSLLRDPVYQNHVASIIRFIGRVEDSVPLDERLPQLPASTLDALAYQIEEVMHLNFPPRKDPYAIPLHFAMSVNDTLLDFTRTYNFIDSYFSDIHTVCFTFPYHQPPVIPSFEDLQKEFAGFLEQM